MNLLQDFLWWDPDIVASILGSNVPFRCCYCPITLAAGNALGRGRLSPGPVESHVMMILYFKTGHFVQFLFFSGYSFHFFFCP